MIYNMASILTSLKDRLSNILSDIPSENENDECDRETSNLELIKVFFKTTIVWSGIYMLSSYGFSISWLLIPLAIVLIRRKEELKQKKAKENVLSSAKLSSATTEKSMIESRFQADELPSWVVFPDKVNNCS